MNALYEEDKMSEKFETGKMTFGNGNPYDADYNSVSDFYINGDEGGNTSALAAAEFL